MASHAVRGNAGMVDRNRTGKRGWRLAMAIVTHVRRWRMRRALGATDTARRMTVHALAGHHLRMIDTIVAEGRWRYAVAGFAHFAGLRMINRLAHGDGRRWLMAGHTVRGNAGMVDCNRTGKRRRWFAMAVVAYVRGRRMCRTLGAANAPWRMTVYTGAGHHLCMIHGKCRETCRRNTMTNFASVGRLRMR